MTLAHSGEERQQGWIVHRRARQIALVIFCMGAILAVASLVLFALNRTLLEVRPDVPNYPIQFTNGVAFLILGCLIVATRPANPLGSIASVMGITGIIGYFTQQYAFYAVITRPGTLPGDGFMIWLNLSVALLTLELGPLFFLLYPTGTLPSRHWRWALWVNYVALATLNLPACIIYLPLMDRHLLLTYATDVPAWAEPLFQAIFGPTVLLLLGITLVATIVRYRRAKGIERDQIKWVALTLFFFLVFNVLQSTLLADTFLRGDATTIFSGTTLAFSLLPLAIGVAILRYHLFDIDRLINRTLVYGVLTGILAAVYFGLVYAWQTLLRGLTGQESSIAVVLSTLVVVALFQQLRRRVQQTIDKRFYRRKYDAAQTIAAFTATVQQDLNLDELSARVVAVVQETMQPESVSLWLKPPKEK